MPLYISIMMIMLYAVRKSIPALLADCVKWSHTLIHLSSSLTRAYQALLKFIEFNDYFTSLNHKRKAVPSNQYCLDGGHVVAFHCIVSSWRCTRLVTKHYKNHWHLHLHQTPFPLGVAPSASPAWCRANLPPPLHYIQMQTEASLSPETMRRRAPQRATCPAMHAAPSPPFHAVQWSTHGQGRTHAWRPQHTR